MTSPIFLRIRQSLYGTTCIFFSWYTQSIAAQNNIIHSQPSESTYSGSVGIESGSFATKRDGYSNTYFNARAKLKRTSQFSFSLDLAHRTDSNVPILGNIEYAHYKKQLSKTNSLSFGRTSPEFTLSSSLSLKDRLNHRVCYTGFECVRGGPIGIHFQSSRLKASLELLSIPDITPMINIDDNGSLSTNNRWASAPVQFVELNGAEVPVRVSTSFPQGVINFIKPGIYLDYNLFNSDNHTTHLGAHLGLSKRLTSIDDDSLRFVTDSNTGDVIAVANSNKEASLTYQQLFWISSQQRVEQNWNITYEGTFLRHESSNSGSLLVGLRFEGRKKFSAHASIGILSELQTIPGADVKVKYQFLEKWSTSISSLLTYSKKQTGILLNPKLTYQFMKNGSLGIEAFLIQSSKNDIILGHNRGNDYLQGELSYAF